jgi:hypothetical protein
VFLEEFMKKKRRFGGVLAVVSAAGMLVVGCNNIHDIDLTEKEGSIALSRQDILALQHLEENHEVSEDELQNRLVEFLKGESLSRNAGWMESAIVGSKKYIARVEKGFSSKTSNLRSADDPEEPSDIPFYVFDLQNGQKGTEGYAIACGDSRIGDIIAVVDDGVLESEPTPFDVIFYTNMEHYIDKTIEDYNSVTDEDIQAALAKLLDEADVEITYGASIGSNRAADRTVVNYYYNIIPQSQSYIRSSLEEPLTAKTLWDQDDEPYNSVIKAYYGYNYNVLAGCVPVAMAQIMAYHEWPGSFQSNLTKSFKDPYTKATRYPRAIPYNWPAMKTKKDAADLATAEAKTQVGALLLDAGAAVKVNYSTSKAYPEDVPAAFKSLKYNVPSGLQSYDFNAVKASIDNKKPIFIGGYSGYELIYIYKYFLWFKWYDRTETQYIGGHAWVIDDYRIKQQLSASIILEFSDRTKEERPLRNIYLLSEELVHCNLGYGSGSNLTGWYKSGVFDTATGVIEEERMNDPGNYTYKVQIVPNITPKK